MAIIIKGPDGAPVSFPDGTDEGTINKAMAQAYPTKGGDQQDHVTTPTVAGAARLPTPASTAPPPSHSDFGLGVWEGSKMPLDNASVAVEAGLRKIGVPVDKVDQWLADHGMGGGTKTGTASEMRSKDIGYLKDQASKGRTPSIAGNIAGSIPAALLTTMATKNPLVMGAITGGLESEAPDLRGVGKDAALGAAFGKAGSVAAKGAAAVAKPVFKPVVNKLLQAGVKLTPGQMTGGTLKVAEDAASSIPVYGDVINAAHNRAIKSFNVAAYNRALEPLGETFPKNVAPGHQGVAYVQQRLGKAYDALYNKTAIQWDQPLQTDIQNVLDQAARNLPPDKAKIFTNTVHDEVARPIISGQRGGTTPLFGQKVKIIPGNPNAPVVPGKGPQQAYKTVGGITPGQVVTPTLKDVDAKLNHLYAQYAGSEDPHNQKFAEYLQDVKSAVHDAATRLNPHVADALKKADAGYSILARIEPAAARAPGGIFTGPQLAQSVKNADLSVRKRATAAGRAKLQDLADAGQQMLRPAIGNSGTASRAAIGGVMGAALFGKGLGLSVNPLAAGAVASTLAPYTRAGGAVLRGALTKRPPGALAVRKALEKSAVPASVAAPLVAQRKRGS